MKAAFEYKEFFPLQDEDSYLIGLGLDVIKKYPGYGHFTFSLDQYPKLKFFFLKTINGHTFPHLELFYFAFKRYEEIVKKFSYISFTGSEISEEDARKTALDMALEHGQDQIGMFLSEEFQLLCVVGPSVSSEEVN